MIRKYINRSLIVLGWILIILNLFDVVFIPWYFRWLPFFIVFFLQLFEFTFEFKYKEKDEK